MAHDPKIRKRAEKLYLSGMKLVDIANKLGLPPGTVRRWKSTYGWNANINERSKKNAERSNRRKKAIDEKISGREENLDNIVELAEIEKFELNDNQKFFCLYYVKYRNKVKAYQKAYGCNYQNACAHASGLWKKEGIQKEINRLLDEYRTEIGLDIRDLFQWYLDIARADINDFVEIEGAKIKTREDIDGVLVSEISETKHGIKVKLEDRMKALEWLTEHIDIGTREQQAKVKLIESQVEKVKADTELTRKKTDAIW